MAWNTKFRTGTDPGKGRDKLAKTLNSVSGSANDPAGTWQEVESPDECFLEVDTGTLGGTAKVDVYGNNAKSNTGQNLVMSYTYAGDDDNIIRYIPLVFGYRFMRVALTNGGTNTISVKLHAGPAPKEAKID